MYFYRSTPSLAIVSVASFPTSQQQKLVISSARGHSHNGTPSVHEEENVSYAVGEKGTPSLNLQNDSDFNAGVNEDDHLTSLEPQGSIDKSVCTPSPDEEGREDDRTVDPNIEQSGELNVGGGKEGKMPTVAEIFKETRQLKSGALDEEYASKLEEIIQTSKDNPHFSAFELVEEYFGPQDRDHVACFGYGMKPKDVRGPLLSRAALQAILQEKEKENIALHKCMNDMENAQKNNMDKLEDQVRMLANLVMANQQTSGANTGFDQDDSMGSFLTALASMGWHCALN
ncbi:hypothetical protein Cgig2_028289 [Carnegiea gigantea]|uniref:Uncharacterized protein n=1 Tax=Carnegiea gigantea TaxID=171969 RepID=A0A9Q1GZU3_9CARY|nr:hypothetical protein Cgig2_028289 [Carnegiea gigantea]